MDIENTETQAEDTLAQNLGIVGESNPEDESHDLESEDLESSVDTQENTEQDNGEEQESEEDSIDDSEENEEEADPDEDTKAKAQKDGALDWEEVDEQYGKAYKHIQSAFTRSQQKLKELEQTAVPKVQLYDQLNALVEADPRRLEIIQSWAKGENVVPEQNSDESLFDGDPLYGEVKALRQELSELKGYTNEQKQTAEQNRQEKLLDEMESNAYSTFNGIFGREARPEDKSEILQFLADNGVQDPKLVPNFVKALYADKHASTKVQSTLKKQKLKKSLPGSKTSSSMNSNKATKSNAGDFDLRDAMMAAAEENEIVF